MQINKYVLNNAIKVVMNDLNISRDEVKIVFDNTVENPENRGTFKVKGGQIYVIIYTQAAKTENQLLRTIAHELRHVWQFKLGYTGRRAMTLDEYYHTYDYNVFELDAVRYAEVMVDGKQFKINKEGMYFSMFELIKFGAHIRLAKLAA